MVTKSKTITLRIDDDLAERLNSCENKSDMIRSALNHELSKRTDSKLNNCVICHGKFPDNELNVVWSFIHFLFFCDECKDKTLTKTNQHWLNECDNLPDLEQCNQSQKDIYNMQVIRSSFDNPVAQWDKRELSKGNLVSLDTYDINKEYSNSLNRLGKSRLDNPSIVNNYKRMVKSYPAYFRETEQDGTILVYGIDDEMLLSNIIDEFVK